MAKTVKAQLKCRHDTAANWTAKNPVLLDGELGVETDTTFFKIGDGDTAWTSLKYVTSKSAVYDNSGNVIADTYAKKTEVTVKGVKVDGAASPLVPDSSGVVTIPNADLSDYATKNYVQQLMNTLSTVSVTQDSLTKALSIK